MQVGSLPVLGAWIEITEKEITRLQGLSRSLYWERGLKYAKTLLINSSKCRSLYWERGLKLLVMLALTQGNTVAPCIGSVD